MTRDELEKFTEELGAKLAAHTREQFSKLATRGTAAWSGPGTVGDDLRKRVDSIAQLAATASAKLAARQAREREAGERAEGARIGKLVGEQLATAEAWALRKRVVAPEGHRPTHAIVDAFKHADHLRALEKATPGYVNRGHVAEAQQLGEALHELGKVAPEPFSGRTEEERSVERPLAAPTAEEWSASAGDPIWRERLVEHNALDSIKAGLRKPGVYR